MDLIVKSASLASWGHEEFACAIGRNGFIAAEDKREGDGKSPIGRWAMREVFYRADRIEKPVTSLPVRALTEKDGWCDASNDANYNRFVTHPYPANAEKLWREDNLYNIIVVLDHNLQPVRPTYGSAIFLHVAPADYKPSSGCITLEQKTLLRVLKEAGAKSAVDIRPML